VPFAGQCSFFEGSLAAIFSTKGVFSAAQKLALIQSFLASAL